MKFFPYCCHFQITSVGTAVIFNLSFTAIKYQTDHQIFIKLRINSIFVVKKCFNKVTKVYFECFERETNCCVTTTKTTCPTATQDV